MKRASALLAATIVATASFAVAQVSIEPPSAPATQPSAPTPAAPAPAAAAPAQNGVSTLPSADATLQQLLKDKPDFLVPAPATPAGGSTTPNKPLVEGVAPNEPPAIRLKEGQYISNRIGRLVRDQKTGTLLFVFDSDGKQMTDPPMGVIPSSLVALMEDASDNGAKPVRFRVSGEVTEYRGRNYLYIKAQQTLRDLNQGLGG